MRYFIALISIVFVISINAQNTQHTQKAYQTKFTEFAPKIDGILDDMAWENCDIATDFVMFQPESGTPEPENLKTEVKITYDHEAIYIAAFMHDDKPEEIPMEFQTRDNFGSADFFGVAINPQNDGINQTLFLVMSTGNQNDAKVLSNGREDWSWNAVWYSDVRLVDEGWIAELKIPYSALRFSNENIQTWSINFTRRHQKTRNQYSWNFIPKDKGNFSQYDGLLKGIKDIHPPIRLNFSPYASASVDEYKGEYDYGWNVGLDLKYGLSESFTLDATLIPDFGQTAYDEQVLNLSPFETKYSEKRQFFTEGLDLFSKGDLFYTRRVGSTPIAKYSIEISEDESIIENPNKVDLINAIKISGRTKSGLGIGFFNAITKKTVATIKNNADNTTREVITEPLANYNVFVVDQQFNKNSSVTMINTHTIREGHFRDADVLGLLYNLKTKNSKYGLKGGFAMSNIVEGNMTTGFEGNIEIGKVSGKHQFDLEFSFRDDKYDKNDLGFQRSNNNMSLQSSYSYRIFEPKGIFNNYGLYLWTNTDFIYKQDTTSPSYLQKTSLYTGTYTGASFWATTKKQLSFGGNINLGIGKQYDYYEPRVTGRFYKTNPNIGLNSWFSSDYRKQLAINGSIYLGTKVNNPQNFTSFSVAPRYRINNHILMQHRLSASKSNNQKGFVDFSDGDIIFGNRNVLSIINTFSTKYNFNTKSSLGLSFRHYFSNVDYTDETFLLNDDGTLYQIGNIKTNDITSNIWNFDLSYSLEFAPGSQLSVLYRNSINKYDKNEDFSFINNVNNMFKEPLLNQLSFKFIYYLDYNSFFKG